MQARDSAGDRIVRSGGFGSTGHEWQKSPVQSGYVQPCSRITQQQTSVHQISKLRRLGPERAWPES